MRSSGRRAAELGSVALALHLALAGCGRVVPHGGETPVPAKPPVRIVDGSDLIPADLDLVVRFDLRKVRSSLGAEVSRDLLGEALDRAGADGLERLALAHADVVWLAVRVADMGAGDRVMVAESLAGEPIEPDPIAWRAHPTGLEGVRRFESIAAAPRHGTSDILAVGRRAAVFVSPVEAISVRRLLDRGPDPERGQPAARGLLSLDYRPRGVATEIRERHRSLARLLDGIERLSATAEIVGRELDIGARIHCSSALAAQRVSRFLQAFRGAGEARENLALLRGLEVDHGDRLVTLRWRLPSDAIASLLARRARAEQDEASDGGTGGEQPERETDPMENGT